MIDLSAYSELLLIIKRTFEGLYRYRGFGNIYRYSMKPKQLKCPFTWEKRQPVLTNRVLYVPDYYDKHHEWEKIPFEHENYFGNKNPLSIEYCSGNGDWIIRMAEKYPERNWIAVEYEFERVRKIWSKLHNRGLSNLIVVSGEALTFSRYYLPSHVIDKFYVNFPDPWPKQKHAKNRLFQKPFIDELARIIKRAGQGMVVTDDPIYAHQISLTMRSHPSWAASFKEPYFVTDWPDYGYSYFDALWREKGKTIHYFQFEKVHL